MLHSGEIDTEQMQDAELDVTSYLRTNGYPINDMIAAYAVVSAKNQTKDTGHLVLKIQTLSKPIDEADAIKDQTIKWICILSWFGLHAYGSSTAKLTIYCYGIFCYCYLKRICKFVCCYD